MRSKMSGRLPVGWRGESYRHYLSAKGIKSGRTYRSAFGDALSQRLSGAYDRTRGAKVAVALQQEKAARLVAAQRGSELLGGAAQPGEEEQARIWVEGTLPKRGTQARVEELKVDKAFADRLGVPWAKFYYELEKPLGAQVEPLPSNYGDVSGDVAEIDRRLDVARADIDRLEAASPAVSKRTIEGALRKEKVLVEWKNQLMNGPLARERGTSREFEVPIYPVVARRRKIHWWDE